MNEDLFPIENGGFSSQSFFFGGGGHLKFQNSFTHHAWICVFFGDVLRIRIPWD